MRRRVSVLMCALLLVAGVCGAAPVSAQSDVKQTRLEAQLQSDGDARWSIVAVVPLEDDRDVQHFESFADAFEQGEQDFELGMDTFERAAEDASQASGREMAIHSEERNARLVNETGNDGEVSRYGVLEVSFTWEQFARVDENETMYVDDAFNTTEGTWLRTLDAGETLVIRSPPGYGGPSTAPTGAQNGDLRWEGPQTFEPGYFELVYPPTGAAGPPSSTDLSTLLLAGAVVLSLLALLLGIYLLWRRESPGESEPAPADVPTEAEGVDADGGGTAAAGGGAGAGAAAAAGADSDEPDLALLSDEERVEYLLEQNGGRMKQANIVKETGWSNAKVSQLLSSMEQKERIDKLRIGRENLISLPGENVGDLAAGHDEE